MSEIKGAPLSNKPAASTDNRPQSVTIVIQANGTTLYTSPAMLRTFSSGKRGYGAYGKTMLPNGEQLQLSVNLTIPHSESK